MNAVIPRPARQAAAVIGGDPHGELNGEPHGDLHVAGGWRIHTADGRLTAVADVVRALLEPHLGDRLLPDPDDSTPVPVPAPDAGSGPAALTLAFDEAPPAPHRTPVGVPPCGGPEPADESYRLTVTGRGITCRAATAEGVFRAATTAVQLITASAARLSCQELTDAPHYAWRGLMIDPARGWLTPGEVRRVIDLAALYKLNVLHLHLTDNEGWRLHLPATPELTAAGEDGTPREFYTTEDYRALQEYAAERFVTVVPEIDLPGHCAALREALPGLPAAPAPEGLAGRFPFVPPLDLADPATRDAVASVFADVCRLTTGPFVHIGGDETVGMTEDSFILAIRELRALVQGVGQAATGLAGILARRDHPGRHRPVLGGRTDDGPARHGGGTRPPARAARGRPHPRTHQGPQDVLRPRLP